MKATTKTFYQLISRNAISDAIESKSEALEWLTNWKRNPNLKSTRLYKVTRTDEYEPLNPQKPKGRK